MFPESITSEETSTNENLYNIISDSEYIRKTPNYDFNKNKTVIKDGKATPLDLMYYLFNKYNLGGL